MVNYCGGTQFLNEDVVLGLPLPSDLNIIPPNASAERARNVFAVETAPTVLVGEQAACQPAPGHPSAINVAFKQWGTELK